MATESGLAFFSRIGCKVNMNSLNKFLFPNAIEPPQIIEVSGEAGTGKTLLCLDMLVSILLPAKWLGINLDGSESSAIYIDCDYHFRIQQLKSLIQKKIESKCFLFRSNLSKKSDNLDSEVKKFFRLNPASLLKEIENLILKCLDNLIILECNNSQQFAITLVTLDQVISNCTKHVSVVIVDSISSFYWFDRLYRSENWKQTESHYSTILQKFFTIIRTNHLFAICTRQNLFKKKHINPKTNKQSNSFNQCEMEYKYLSKDWFIGMDWKIVMQPYLSSSFTNSEENACMYHCIKVYKKNLLLRTVKYSFVMDEINYLDL